LQGGAGRSLQVATLHQQLHAQPFATYDPDQIA
jgi:hypothetical protein